MKSDEMRAVLEKWKASKQSLREFGKLEGVAYSKLVYWRNKLFKPAKRKPGPKLIPVRVVPDLLQSPSTPEIIRVCLPNEISIEVPVGPGDNDLERLVRMLTSC